MQHKKFSQLSCSLVLKNILDFFWEIENMLQRLELLNSRLRILIF